MAACQGSFESSAAGGFVFFDFAVADTDDAVAASGDVGLVLPGAAKLPARTEAHTRESPASLIAKTTFVISLEESLYTLNGTRMMILPSSWRRAKRALTLVGRLNRFKWPRKALVGSLCNERGQPKAALRKPIRSSISGTCGTYMSTVTPQSL